MLERQKIIIPPKTYKGISRYFMEVPGISPRKKIQTILGKTY